ncbi:sensor histidine kinase, partial [uncultured Jannaschia sp.]|uniref:sensor histidine kinase n=1 Tax=uncultured Jannaschia sp. TaxID=293347 RepID=UPI00260A81F3
MKNTLAMVQAIVTQTFRTAGSLEEGQEAITGRLMALANAQDILTSAGASQAYFGEIVETALAPYRTGEGRYAVSGPSISINAPQALGLSLAIHELATNAAKHGALSSERGRVDITWKLLGDGRLRFDWIEAGGPPVTAPVRTGFDPAPFEWTPMIGFRANTRSVRWRGR